MRVYFVLMPWHSRLRALVAQHPASERFIQSCLHDLKAIPGVQVLDCRGFVPDAGFNDCDHLPAGSLRSAFSLALGDLLRQGRVSLPP